jgi:hypothetical protein
LARACVARAGYAAVLPARQNNQFVSGCWTCLIHLLLPVYEVTEHSIIYKAYLNRQYHRKFPRRELPNSQERQESRDLPFTRLEKGLQNRNYRGKGPEPPGPKSWMWLAGTPVRMLFQLPYPYPCPLQRDQGTKTRNLDSKISLSQSAPSASASVIIGKTCFACLPRICSVL